MQKVEVCIFAKIDRPLRYITYAVFKCGIHSISQNQSIINAPKPIDEKSLKNLLIKQRKLLSKKC